VVSAVEQIGGGFLAMGAFLLVAISFLLRSAAYGRHHDLPASAFARFPPPTGWCSVRGWMVDVHADRNESDWLIELFHPLAGGLEEKPLRYYPLVAPEPAAREQRVPLLVRADVDRVARLRLRGGSPSPDPSPAVVTGVVSGTVPVDAATALESKGWHVAPGAPVLDAFAGPESDRFLGVAGTAVGVGGGGLIEIVWLVYRAYAERKLRRLEARD
jgi:hypothetical protein